MFYCKHRSQLGGSWCRCFSTYSCGKLVSRIRVHLVLFHMEVCLLIAQWSSSSSSDTPVKLSHVRNIMSISLHCRSRMVHPRTQRSLGLRVLLDQIGRLLKFLKNSNAFIAASSTKWQEMRKRKTKLSHQQMQKKIFKQPVGNIDPKANKSRKKIPLPEGISPRTTKNNEHKHESLKTD